MFKHFLVYMLLAFCLFLLLTGGSLLYLWYKFEPPQHHYPLIAVLDTGIDSNHPLFHQRLTTGFDFVEWDFVPNDEVGHGTHISGLIAKKTDQSTILPLRFIDEKSKISIIPAIPILYSILRGADVINMSFHSDEDFFTKWCIKLGQKKGIIFVAASGNDGKKDRINFPAYLPGVIAVGATDPTSRELYEGNNITDRVDILAPGVRIRSSFLKKKYKYLTGTSMASGNMTGMISFIKEHFPTLEKKEILELINDYSRETTHPSFKEIDYLKLRAHQKNFVYLWVDDELDPLSNFVIFDIDSDHTNFTLVKRNDHPLTLLDDGTNRIEFPLVHGENHFELIAYGDSIVRKTFNYYTDQMPPIVDLYRANTHTNHYYYLIIDDSNDVTISINGSLQKPIKTKHLGNSDSNTSTYLVKRELVKRQLTRITIEDSYGNRSYKLFTHFKDLNKINYPFLY